MVLPATTYKKHSGIYRNYDNSPLTRDQIRVIAPSVFGDQEDPSRSEKYRFVSSDSLLDQMEENGFLVVGAQEQRSRKSNGMPVRKHLLRFAHRDVLETLTREERVELVMINSHNGSCSYQLMAGVFRQVCTNGLIVGSKIAAINIKHIGRYDEDVIGASLNIARQSPIIAEDMYRMAAIEIPYKRQIEFAHEAAQLRLGDKYLDKIEPEVLLRPQRWNDIRFSAEGTATVWQVFNRVQERLVRGGVPLLRDEKGRYPSLRAINNIDGNTRLNLDLWNLADKYAAAC